MWGLCRNLNRLNSDVCTDLYWCVKAAKWQVIFICSLQPNLQPNCINRFVAIKFKDVVLSSNDSWNSCTNHVMIMSPWTVFNITAKAIIYNLRIIVFLFRLYWMTSCPFLRIHLNWTLPFFLPPQPTSPNVLEKLQQSFLAITDKPIKKCSGLPVWSGLSK